MKRICTYLFFCVTVSTLLSAAPFSVKTEAFLELHCFDCHGDGAAKGGLDLEELGRDLSDVAVFAKWERIFDRVDSGRNAAEEGDGPARGRGTHGVSRCARAAN